MNGPMSKPGPQEQQISLCVIVLQSMKADGDEEAVKRLREAAAETLTTFIKDKSDFDKEWAKAATA